MNLPGFAADASLHKTNYPYYPASNQEQAMRAFRPSAPIGTGLSHPLARCTYGVCIPKINCVDYGGGSYDCWIEYYRRMRCCWYPSFGPALGGGKICDWTGWGCPPGHDISP